MNRASQARYELAQRVAQPYQHLPEVAAIFVGGSTSRGHADAYSDIEIGIIWHTLPSETVRQQACAAAKADLIYLYPFSEAEQAYYDALQVGRRAPAAERSGILAEMVQRVVLNDEDPRGAVGSTVTRLAEIMRSCGLTVAPNPSEFGATMAGGLASKQERRAIA